MTPNITIKITQDTATGALVSAMAKVAPRDLAGRVGEAGQRLVREHLAKLGPNAQGWPSTGFYEKFSDNVRWLPAEGGVYIAILPALINGRQVGLRLRVFGGTIQPQNVDMLAIPISPVSYGHVPSDFPNLFLLKTAKGAYLVQRGQDVSPKTGRLIGRRNPGGNAGRTLRAELNFLYKLTASVTQAGNRSVLPSDEELLQTALNACRQDWGGAH